MTRRGSARMSWLVAIAVVAVSLVIGSSASSVAAAPARVIVRGPATHKTIALTIDDGWDPERCQEIYDTLVGFGIPATWLPNAIHVRDAKALWRRIGARFEIANHTTHHPSLPSLSRAAMRREIKTDEQIVESITGREMSKILRPPYGAYDDRVLREAGRLGYGVVALWDVSAADTASDPGDRKVAQNMLRGKAGSVILLHCGPPVTPRVLPIVIARYACKGFRFASLGDLLAGQPGVDAEVSCPPPGLPPPKSRRRPASTGLAEELLAQPWRLVATSPNDVMEAVAPEDTLTLRFAGHTAGGALGCQTYSMRVKTKADGSLKFAKVVRDDGACPGPLAPEPTDALGTLASMVGYRTDGEAIVFVDAKGRDRLRFDPTAQEGVLGEWDVASVADETGLLVATLADSQPTVTFTATGQVRGSTGCDTYSSTYSTLDAAITIGAVLTGDGGCDDPLADQAARFLAALGVVAAWRIDGSVLELVDAEQRVVLGLRPTGIRPAPSPSLLPSAVP